MEKKKSKKFLVSSKSEMAGKVKVSELKRLLKAKKEKEISSQIFNLEEKNFHVNHSGWKKKTDKREITYLENPGEDIWEYVSGVSEDLIGQQLFTWSAAMRETEKAGKRMPTDEEWNVLKDKKNFSFSLKKVFPGIRDLNSIFYSLGTETYFWSSSVSCSYGWARNLFSSYSIVYRCLRIQGLGFSVRCLKD